MKSPPHFQKLIYNLYPKKDKQKNFEESTDLKVLSTNEKLNLLNERI